MVAEVTGECRFRRPAGSGEPVGDHEITASESYGGHYQRRNASRDGRLACTGTHARTAA